MVCNVYLKLHVLQFDVARIVEPRFPVLRTFNLTPVRMSDFHWSQHVTSERRRKRRKLQEALLGEAGQSRAPATRPSVLSGTCGGAPQASTLCSVPYSSEPCSWSCTIHFTSRCDSVWRLVPYTWPHACTRTPTRQRLPPRTEPLASPLWRSVRTDSAEVVGKNSPIAN